MHKLMKKSPTMKPYLFSNVNLIINKERENNIIRILDDFKNPKMNIIDAHIKYSNEHKIDLDREELKKFIIDNMYDIRCDGHLVKSIIVFGIAIDKNAKIKKNYFNLNNCAVLRYVMN